MFRLKSKNTNPATLLEGRSNVLGQKDRKQLRQRFSSQFPQAGVDAFDQLFPSTAALTCLSLKGRTEDIYHSGDEDPGVPMCLTLSKNKKAPLVPTLFALWKIPGLLPEIFVVQDAPKYLFNGADLMLPGCIMPPSGNFAEAGMDQGQIWAVRIRGNPMPFAIGEVQMTQAELQTATKGVILKILLIAGDALTAAHPEVVMPKGFTTKNCVPLDQVDKDGAVTESDDQGLSGEDGDSDYDDGSFGPPSEDDEEVAERRAKREAARKDRLASKAAKAAVKVEGKGAVATVAVNKAEEQEDVGGSDAEEGSADEGEGEETIDAVPSEAKEYRRGSTGSDSAASGIIGKVPSATIEELVLFFLIEIGVKKVSDNQLPMDASAIWGMIAQLAQVGMIKCQDELSAWLKVREVPLPGRQTRGESGSGVDEEQSPFSWDDVIANFELKKTSWKDLKRMANHFKKTKLWQLRELRGNVSIVKINRSHPLFQKHKPLPLDISPTTVPQKKVAGLSSSRKGTAAALTSPASAVGSPSPASSSSAGLGIRAATRAYQSTAASREFLESGGLTDPKALLSEKHVAELITRAFRRLHKATIPSERDPTLGAPEPVKAADEGAKLETDEDDPRNPCPDWVELLRKEPKLLPICVDKGTRQKLKTGELRDLPPLTNQEILEKFTHNAMKTVTILIPINKTLETAAPGEVDLIEADAKVVVDLHKTKRFVRTRISGIHHFSFVDMKALTEKLQKTCAASASLVELEDVKGKSKPMGIVVQGVVIDQVCQVLQNYAGIPKNLIEAQR